MRKRNKNKLRRTIDRGRKLLVSGDQQEAYEFLEEAVKEFSQDAEVRLLYATILLAVRPDDVPSEIAKAVELAPEDPMILVRAASLMFDRRQLDAAHTYANRARELALPDFAMKGPLANVEGRLAAYEKKYDIAEDKFGLAVELNPADPILARDFVKLLAARGRHAEAVEAIDQALPRVQNRHALDQLRRKLVGSSASD
jgi:tetratricopeptide (TPR) repeat protein